MIQTEEFLEGSPEERVELNLRVLQAEEGRASRKQLWARAQRHETAWLLGKRSIFQCDWTSYRVGRVSKGNSTR